MDEVIGTARLESTNQLIAKHIRRDAFVLEIGANDASFARFHDCARWLTVDKYGAPDVRADLDGPTTRLPFESSTVDIVVCTEVLEHLAMGTPLVREIGRVLKPGGAAIVSVPNVCSLKSRIRMLFGALPNMAAAGDCGHPLGGTGMLVDGNWVAAHVVDFNLERLRLYLERGCLEVTEAKSLPTKFRIGPASVTLPRGILPPTLCDFVLVSAIRNSSDFSVKGIER